MISGAVVLGLLFGAARGLLRCVLQLQRPILVTPDVAGGVVVNGTLNGIAGGAQLLDFFLLQGEFVRTSLSDRERVI